MKLSVVLSFRNEETVLPELIRRLEASLDPLKCDYELIFVNDASTDNSFNLLKQRHETDRRIKVITMSRRFGVSPCVFAGMAYASGEAVVYMDADLQDPPEVIPDLVRKWKEGADVVYTTRISRAGESFLRLLVTKWAYRILRLLSDDIELPVNSGDFKLLDRRVVNELLTLKEKDAFVRGLVSWVGFKQVQVLYRREPRFSGRSHFPLLSPGPIKAFISGVTSFSTVPLILALLSGLAVSCGAFVYVVVLLLLRGLGMPLPAWSPVMVGILFLGGMQLFTLGIMGLYIGRIHAESRNRPNYVVESTLGL